MRPRQAAVGSAIFFLFGPGFEAGLGPALLTRGFARGDDLPAQPAATVVGVLLILGGLAVLVRCFVGFARDGRGTPTPAAPTGALVVDGPYAHVRNPQQLATAAVIVGEGLALARPILFIAAAAYLVTLAWMIRRYEEPRLRERFGPAYDAYAVEVSAWIPRFRPPSSAAG